VAGSSIIKLLSPDVSRWISALSRKLDQAPEQIAEDMGQKIINLDREAPQIIGSFKDVDIYEALREANEGASDIGLMAPSNFRKLAAEIPMEDPKIRDLVNKNVQYQKDLMESGIAPDAIPYLGVRRGQVVGHDSRHQSRANEALGIKEQLVRLIPENSDLVSKLPKNTKLLPEPSLSGKPREGVGTLENIIKFLSAPAATLGALSQLPQEPDL
tara:strand:+ start:73 stop:714 length:642 start_codon:yes stop_codon:yes gene_type:complete